MMMNISNRFANMAIVCAFLVAVIHCRPPFESGTGMWWIKQMLECGICTIAVPFFFVASGYFVAGHVGEKGWYSAALIKRMRTLVVPYFIWMTVCLLFDVAYRLSGGREIVKMFAPDNLGRFYGIALTGCPGLTPLWYVRGLLVLMLFSPVLLYIANLKCVCKGLGLVLLFVVYGAICPGPVGSGFLHGLTRCGILPLAGVFYFSFGMLMRCEGMDMKTSRSKAVLWLVVGLLLAWGQAFAKICGWGVEQYLGCLAIPFMLHGVWNIVPDCKWPKWLVGCSFPVYVRHKFFYPFAHKAFGGTGTWFGYLLTAVFVFGMSLVVANIFKKILPRMASFAFGGR